MGPNIEIHNAFKGAGFKVLIDGRAFYINRANTKRFLDTKDAPTKEAIKAKVESNVIDFYAFFSETQRVR